MPSLTKHIKTNIIIFILLQTSILSQTPENIFLRQLKKYSDQYGSKPAKLKDPENKALYSPEKKKIISDYKWSLPKIWLGLEGTCYYFLERDNYFPYKGEILNHLQKNKPLTADKLYNFFKEKIEAKQFSIQEGDIAMVLPFNLESFKIATMLKSSYAHWDMIWIRDDGTPMLFLTHPGGVKKITLAEFLTGYFNHNDVIAIYRYNGSLNKKKLKQTISAINKNFHNIYYDDAFYKDIEIKDINTHFLKPQFFYCGELVYTVYQHVLGNTAFASGHYSPLRQLFYNQKVEITPSIELLLTYAEKMEKKNNQWIIDPTSFYLSKSFKRIAIIGDSREFKDRFKKTTTTKKNISVEQILNRLKSNKQSHS